jgi:hypothetical protein
VDVSAAPAHSPRLHRDGEDLLETSSTSGTRSVLKVVVGTVAAAGDAEDLTPTAPMLTNDYIDEGAGNAVRTWSDPAMTDPRPIHSLVHRLTMEVPTKTLKATL